MGACFLTRPASATICWGLGRAAAVLALAAVGFAWPLEAQAPASAAAPADAAVESGPAAILGGLMTAQQQAVQGGDPATIVPASQRLAAYALELQGIFYARQERWANAVATLEQSFAIEPDLNVVLRLIGLEVQTGQGEAAKTTREKLLSIQGKTPALYLALGNAYQAGGDLDGAIALVGTAVTLAPESAVGHLALGSLYWTLNYQQYNPDTLREFTAAEKLDPKNLLVVENLGELLSEYREYGPAEEYLKQAIQQDPQAIDPEMQLGMNSYVQHDLEGARAALTQVVQLARAQGAHERQLGRALFALSRIAAEENRPTEAESLARESEAVHEQVVRAGGGAMLTESVGVDADAVAGLNAGKGGPASTQTPAEYGAVPEGLSARLETIAAQSLNDAGTSLARQHDYAGSLPFFEQAGAAAPDLVPVMRNLGLAAFHVEDWALAVKALGAALKLDASDGLVQRDLGEAQQHLGQAAP